MKQFGLIGKTLKHSFSKDYFTQKFEAEKLFDYSYHSFELDNIDRLPELLLQHPQLCGLNVTIPYKEAVLKFLDEEDVVVKTIGACNCIKISRGKLLGYNTDVFGFKTSLQPLLQARHNKALVLGTGGAAKAVAYVLQQLNIDFQWVSRKENENHLTYDSLTEEMLHNYPLIINTTPLGTFPNVDECPPIPYNFLTSRHLLFDLIYNPAKTAFLIKGEEKGATIKNGYEMLVLQAEASWKIWNA